MENKLNLQEYLELVWDTPSKKYRPKLSKKAFKNCNGCALVAKNYCYYGLKGNRDIKDGDLDFSDSNNICECGIKITYIKEPIISLSGKEVDFRIIYIPTEPCYKPKTKGQAIIVQDLRRKNLIK